MLTHPMQHCTTLTTTDPPIEYKVIPGWNHLDYVIGKDNDVLMNRPILRILEKRMKAEQLSRVMTEAQEHIRDIDETNHSQGLNSKALNSHVLNSQALNSQVPNLHQFERTFDSHLVE